MTWLSSWRSIFRSLFKHWSKSFIKFRCKQLLKFGLRWLVKAWAFHLLWLWPLLIFELQALKAAWRCDAFVFILLQSLENLVLCNFLDNVRAEVLLGRIFDVRLSYTLPEFCDLFVDSYLLSHDTLNVNFVRIVFIFYQSSLDCLSKSLWVDWKLGSCQDFVDMFFICILTYFSLASFVRYLWLFLVFCAWFACLDLSLLSFCLIIVYLYAVSFGDYLPMSFCSWETADILFHLVTQSVRLSAEEWLSSHNVHRHDSVQLTLQLFSWLVLLNCINITIWKPFGALPHLLLISEHFIFLD